MALSPALVGSQPVSETGQKWKEEAGLVRIAAAAAACAGNGCASAAQEEQMSPHILLFISDTVCNKPVHATSVRTETHVGM